MAGEHPSRGLGAHYAGAVVVTLLWSSSFVLIKWGLQGIPPIYFATLRYVLAFAVLAAADIALRRRGGRDNIRGTAVSRTLIVAGICGYTVAQGLQFVGLFFLPAVTTAFILNFNPIFVLVIGLSLLGERIGPAEALGSAVALGGAFVFFYEQVSWQGQWFGVLITIASGVGWAAYVVLIRGLQKTRRLDSLRLTSTTMGVGALGLVTLTLLTGEYARITPNGFAIIVWLATVNTALAFFVWNWALASIPAYDLTMLQNVMLIEIAFFSLAFLQESLTPLMVAGMALVLAGVFLVQVRGSALRSRPAARGSGTGP